MSKETQWAWAQQTDSAGVLKKAAKTVLLYLTERTNGFGVARVDPDRIFYGCALQRMNIVKNCLDYLEEKELILFRSSKRDRVIVAAPKYMFDPKSTFSRSNLTTPLLCSSSKD